MNKYINVEIFLEFLLIYLIILFTTTPIKQIISEGLLIFANPPWSCSVVELVLIASIVVVVGVEVTEVLVLGSFVSPDVDVDVGFVSGICVVVVIVGSEGGERVKSGHPGLL